MLDRIEAWRKKPIAVKRRYALTAAVLVSLIVVGIWSTTLPTRLSVFDFSETDVAVAPQESKDVVPAIIPPEAPSSFSRFTASVADGFASVRNKFWKSEPEPAAVSSPATTTSEAWTEAVEAMQTPETAGPAKPIIIRVATTTGATTTTASSSTTSAPVLQ